MAAKSKWEMDSLRLEFDRRKSRFGIDFEAKPEQLKIVISVLNNNDVIGVCPTGFGKSLCIVIPTMISDTASTTLVISPLTALMDDQADKFNRLGISAVKIDTSSLTQPEVTANIKQAKYQVVLCSPEMALKPEWKEAFLSDEWQKKILLLVVDEAHCISEWGDDFRPEYKMLHELKSIFSCPLMALTATTTSSVKDDILKHLHLHVESTDIVALKPDRPEIFLDVAKKETGHRNFDSLTWLLHHLREKKEQAKKTIVYCRSVNAVAELYRSIKLELGHDAFIDGIRDHDHVLVEMFHRSLTDELKTKILDNFKRSDGSIKCLVASAAIGMGIDVPNVDIVCHVGAPKSILSFWQEAGRCARDGRKGYSLILWDSFTLSSKTTEAELAKIIRNEAVCFRQLLMANFLGSSIDDGRSPTCGSCKEGDICECKKCRCCWVCLRQCPCQEKVHFGLKTFLSL